MKEFDGFNKIPFFTAGNDKKVFTLGDIRTLRVFFMRYLCPELVLEIKKYIHENIYIFMELPILEVCSMISNEFNLLWKDVSEMMDFVMISLMGYQKSDITEPEYHKDGIIVELDFDIKNTSGSIDWIYIKSVIPDRIVSDGSGSSNVLELRVLQSIGDGAFSVVFLVKNNLYCDYPFKYLAMKLFTADNGDWKEAKNNFLRELSALQIISEIDGVINPIFVLQLSVLGEEYFAYSMRYFVNKTLHDYAAGLTRTEILKMLEPLAQTMKKCHDEGVFHGDLKPENILIWDNGKPVLSDWGIAKRTNFKSWIFDVSTLIYTSWFRDPWNWRGKDFKASVISEIWALLLSFLDCLSHGGFRGDEKFNVFRIGEYFGLKSQEMVDDAIKSVFGSDCSPACTFFKKWLNIKRFMTITTTVPPDHPKMFDDLYREFFHDLNLVLDTLKPNGQLCETESSD